MSNSHNHGKASSQKILFLALFVTLTYAAVEAVGGWFANSLALIGDAGHMLTDSAALAVGAFVAWLANKKASTKLSFGFQRAEVLGALFNVFFMYVIVAVIVASSIHRFQEPQPVDFSTVMLIGTIGLIINVFVAWLLSRGEQTLNTRGALLHVMGDLLGSVAAIGAGVVIWLTGWMPIDPILSLLICVLILISSTRLLLESIHVVMEGVPADIDQQDVERALLAADEDIVDIHHVHIWTVSSKTRALSAHVVINSTERWGVVLEKLVKISHDDFEINHCTFQAEAGSDRCPDQSGH
jgi:cobalt-zinc-cadmium efflux system protein